MSLGPSFGIFLRPVVVGAVPSMFVARSLGVLFFWSVIRPVSLPPLPPSPFAHLISLTPLPSPAVICRPPSFWFCCLFFFFGFFVAFPLLFFFGFCVCVVAFGASSVFLCLGSLPFFDFDARCFSVVFLFSWCFGSPGAFRLFPVRMSPIFFLFPFGALLLVFLPPVRIFHAFVVCYSGLLRCRYFFLFYFLISFCFSVFGLVTFPRFGDPLGHYLLCYASCLLIVGSIFVSWFALFPFLGSALLFSRRFRFPFCASRAAFFCSLLAALFFLPLCRRFFICLCRFSTCFSPGSCSSAFRFLFAPCRFRSLSTGFFFLVIPVFSLPSSAVSLLPLFLHSFRCCSFSAFCFFVAFCPRFRESSRYFFMLLLDVLSVCLLLCLVAFFSFPWSFLVPRLLLCSRFRLVFFFLLFLPGAFVFRFFPYFSLFCASAYSLVRLLSPAFRRNLLFPAIRVSISSSIQFGALGPSSPPRTAADRARSYSASLTLLDDSLSLCSSGTPVASLSSPLRTVEGRLCSTMFSLY